MVQAALAGQPSIPLNMFAPFIVGGDTNTIYWKNVNNRTMINIMNEGTTCVSMDL